MTGRRTVMSIRGRGWLQLVSISFLVSFELF